MSNHTNIAFSCLLTLEANQKLKCISEYNNRKPTQQFRQWIDTEYETMKRNLED